MHILLIAHRKHHKKYFNFLVRHCSVSMKVYSSSTLPRKKMTWWWRVMSAGHKDMVAYHMKNKMRSRQYGLHDVTGGRTSRGHFRPLKDRLYAGAYEQIYLLKARWAYVQMKEVYRRERPDAVVVWNGGAWLFKAAIQAAREEGIAVFYAENGLLPNTTTFDPKGINYENSMPRDVSFYEGLRTFRSDFEGNLVPRSSARSDKAKVVSLPRKYIFVPFQVNTDSQIILHSPWIRDMYELLDILRRVIGKIKDQEVVFVLKQHPSCRCNYDRYHRALGPRILFANGNNTQDLIQGAEGVLTINSTVGIESLLLKKKVIVMGRAFYALDGLVLVAGNEDMLVQSIDHLPAWQPDELLRMKFLTYLADEYCIPGSWRNPDALHCRKIEDRLYRVLVEGATL